jgi:hypothetical protein
LTPPSAKSVEQLVRDAPGPNLDQITVAPEATMPSEPIIGDDGYVNFPAIYGLAKLPPSAFTAEQVLQVLGSLPADLPIESKRATIKVTLDAMTNTLGVSPQSIVVDAGRKLAALDAYSQSYGKQATEFVSKTEVEILSLQDQIKQKQDSIEAAKKKQGIMTEACTSEADRLHTVVEFFSTSAPTATST